MPEITDITSIELEGKVVRLRQRYFKAGLNAADHLFRCEGGFGCHPWAMGTKIAGTFLSDGEEACIRRQDVEAVIED
jgi:hypothetical protein